MARWRPPTLDELLYESEHKRSMHPTLSDGEMLDYFKQHLETNSSEFPLHIRQLTVPNQRDGPFRVADGRLCHYVQATKVMSTSISSILAEAMPWLWIAANKFWGTQSPQTMDTIRELPYPVAPNPLGRPAKRFHRFIFANLSIPIEIPLHLHFVNPLAFHEYRYTSIRFCVVRDPVERFLSAWRDLRIREPDKFGKLNGPEEFFHVISHPDTKKEYRDMHHLTQTHYLGEDPRYYTHIFPMHDVPRLKEFLSEISGKPITMLHQNRSKKGDKNHDIPASLRQRIEKYYAQDYQIWGRYF